MQTRTALAENTARFHEWERLGRGTMTFPHLVPLEPPFRPFAGHRQPGTPIRDDGRRHTVISRLREKFFHQERVAVIPTSAGAETASVRVAPVPETEVEELEILIPDDQKFDPSVGESLLRAIATVGDAVSYELVGHAGRVSLRIGCAPPDRALIETQLASFLPFATVEVAGDSVVRVWRRIEAQFIAGIEFALDREFMLPLRESPKTPELLLASIGALAQAGENDLAVLQVLFAPAGSPWASHAREAVTSPDGEPFFIDAPEITKLADEKFSSPLYAVAVRMLACTNDESVAERILRGIGAAVGAQESMRNSFVGLPPDDVEDFQFNVLLRCTNRSGMLLSLRELASITRLPGPEIRTPALVRTRETARLPKQVLSESGVVLGEAEHEGMMVPVRLPLETRLNHMYVIGASGTGKSTFLEGLIEQDIAEGRGLALLDPHGDLVDAVLSRIPEHRVEDVVLFDPSDTEWVVGWNILGANSEIEKEMLASDLVAVWKRLSTSWGDQMSAVLGNAVLAFLESSVGGTLIDLRKFLLDEKFRAAFLGTIRDDHVRSFWREEFPLLIGRKPQAPILTRLDTLLRSRLVREAVVEREKPLNFREIMDGKKIFLAKLAQGAIGEENAALLGSLLVSKIHQTALARQSVSIEEREPFFLFADEFQSVATPSMASLFSGVRKFKLAVCVAHQDLYQIHSTAPELERSILASAHTRIVFRVSEDDARRIERGMGEFGEEDLVNLARGEAVCRLGTGSQSFNLRTIPLPPLDRFVAQARRDGVRSLSLERYGRRRTPIATEDVQSETPSKPREKDRVAAAPGRGGRQHKYLQGLIKKAAEERGFEVALEKRVLGGHGHIDVALSLGATTVACEISVTTGVEHETGNLAKCLAAGFSYAVLVSSEPTLLKQAEDILSEEATDAQMEHVRFLTPVSLIEFLDRVRRDEAREEQGSKPESESRGQPRTHKPPAAIPDDPKAMLDVEQASEYLRRAPQTLAKLRSVGGGPPFYKIGRNVYYQRADLDEWLALRRRRSTSDIS